MSERSPILPSQPEASDATAKDKKKKSKSGSVVAPGSAPVVPEQRARASQESTALGEKLGVLIIGRNHEQGKSTRVESKVDAAKDKTVKTVESDKNSNTEESLESLELSSTRLGGGEVVIDLGKPMVELVVPRNGERPDDKAKPSPRNINIDPDVASASAEEPPEPYVEVPEALPSLESEEPYHSTHDSDERPKQAAASGGGTTPPIKPPITPSGPFEESPMPDNPGSRRRPMPYSLPPEPAQMAHEYAPQPLATERVDSEPAATKEDVREAVNAAGRRGASRAVLAGLVVGVGYEHFTHKRRERKTNQRQKLQNKKLNAAEKQYAFGIKENERQQAEAAARLNMAESRYQNTTAGLEKRTQQAEQAAAAAQAEVQAQQERLAIPAEHRLQTSAWHTIEVDAKTGKAVENPSFQYGHEYYRERAQEITPAQQRDMMTGEIAVAGATSSPQAATANDDIAAAARVPDATTQTPQPVTSQPTPNAQGRQPAAKQPDAPSAPLWPWVLALIVIGVSLIMLLR